MNLSVFLSLIAFFIIIHSIINNVSFIDSPIILQLETLRAKINSKENTYNITNKDRTHQINQKGIIYPLMCGKINLI